MLDSNSRYNDLQDQVKDYQKYAKPEAWLSENSIVVFVLLFTFVAILISTFNLTVAIFLVPVVYIVVAYFLTKNLGRKSRVYQLDTDEWLVYYSFVIVDNLDKSHKRKKTELKEEYRKKAINAGRLFLAIVKRKWNVGDFKIAKTALGSQISKFRSNLEYRVLPALEGTNEQDSLRVRGFFFDLAFYLDHASPSIANLKSINENISVLTSREEEIRKKQRGMVMRLKDLLLTPRTLRHLSVFSGIGFLGVIVYLVGLNLDLVSKDGAFVASIGFAGLLVVAYLDYLRKEKTS